MILFEMKEYIYICISSEVYIYYPMVYCASPLSLSFLPSEEKNSILGMEESHEVEEH